MAIARETTHASISSRTKGNILILSFFYKSGENLSLIRYKRSEWQKDDKLDNIFPISCPGGLWIPSVR
ncbi:hypothetical protein OIU85_020690 [Salix viminalis]|uniref:Uncharacterized protein n=1 Tax=Salix viminalis TaxID=40686 RepID=A0A9Q0ZCZ1_SALVM|nr:hypothetical protein OIU85_020690 [Salix viminalis]